MRVDAQRNRERVLRAARVLISERGPGVGMDEIARASGVAVGTLYRHFPTKTDLVRAVVDDSITAIATETQRAVDAIVAGSPAAQEFATTFARVAERHSTDLALKNAARGIGVLVPTSDLPDTPQTKRALELIVALLELAVTAGVVRRDTTVTDVMVLLDGVPPPELGAGQRERYVDLVLRGLRP